MKEVLVELANYIMTSNYAHAILILALFIFCAWALLYFFKHVVEKVAHKNASKMSDRIVVTMETPLIIMMILVGIQLAAERILINGILFDNIVYSIMIIIVTIMFISISSIVITYWAKSKGNKDNDEFHQEVQPLVKSLSKMVLIGIAILIILQMWGVKVGTTVASLGVIGVVLGFAFQDTMKNIFGGISLIVDDSIHKKDIIRLESGEMGEVVEVNLRSTKIKTFDSEYLIIPNGVLSNTKIINLAEPTSTLRIDIPVSVAYGSDPERVRNVLLGVLRNKERVLKFPKREARFVKMNEYSIDFMLLFYISNFREQFEIRNIVVTDVYNALREHNIEIPFPTRSILSAKDIQWKIKKKKTISKKKVAKKTSKKKKTTRKKRK